MKCPVPIQSKDRPIDGVPGEYWWSDLRPCGATMTIVFTGAIDLEWIEETYGVTSDYELDAQEGISEAYCQTWEVRCSAGHVLARAYHDGADPHPFTWAQIPGVTLPADEVRSR